MDLRFDPPGPVAYAFMHDRSDLSAIMGPVGSAKTSTCIFKLLHISAEQARSPIDGIRYSKWMVVRDTYRNLNRTTLKSFKTWLPLNDKQWTGGGSEPAQLHLRAKLRDGSVMDLLVEFVALGDNDIEDVARGWEGTGVWLNEADLLAPDVLSYLAGRTGRYPSSLHGGATWDGIIMDYNAPDIENYLYNLFENREEIDFLDEDDDLLDGNFKLFKQPGGRDKNAENLQHLKAGYYDKQAKLYLAQDREDLVRRMIDNNYGYSRDGKPVYGDYSDNIHCAAEDLQPVRGAPIKMVCDQGLRPALLFRQTLPDGRRIYLDEFYCESGAEGLAELVIEAQGSNMYRGFTFIGGYCDPAGDVPDDKGSAETWLGSLNRFLNLKGAQRITAAPTNAPERCVGATRLKFKELVQGKPEIQISPRCRQLRKALNSAYCYKKKRMANGGYEDKPIKKFPTSDLANALEFDCLDDGGYEAVIGRAARAKPFGSGKSFKAKVEVRV